MTSTMTRRDRTVARLRRLRPRGTNWLLYVVSAVAVTVLGLGYVHDRANQSANAQAQRQSLQSQRQSLACIETWADAYTARAQFINRYSVPRINAQDALEVAVIEGQSDAVLVRLRQQFLAASNAYTAAVSANPPLPAPRFLCAERNGQNPPAVPGGLPTNVPPAEPIPQFPSTTAVPSATPAAPTTSAAPGSGSGHGTVTGGHSASAAATSTPGPSTSSRRTSASAPVTSPASAPSSPEVSSSPGLLRRILCLVLTCPA